VNLVGGIRPLPIFCRIMPGQVPEDEEELAAVALT